MFNLLAYSKITCLLLHYFKELFTSVFQIFSGKGGKHTLRIRYQTSFVEKLFDFLVFCFSDCPKNIFFLEKRVQMYSAFLLAQVFAKTLFLKYP